MSIARLVAAAAVLHIFVQVAQLPVSLGGSICAGATGTPDQHFHPCQPAYHDQQCSPRCADGYKCTQGCPGDASQGGDVSSRFKCDKHGNWQPWDAYSHHPAGWEPMKCVKKVPCESLAEPPFDANARWESGSACATASEANANGSVVSHPVPKVMQADGTSCAAVCAAGFYRVAQNGSSGDADAPSGPTVNVSCQGGTWTSPLDIKSNTPSALRAELSVLTLAQLEQRAEEESIDTNELHSSLEGESKRVELTTLIVQQATMRGPCVKDLMCSVVLDPKPHTAWHDASLCARLSTINMVLSTTKCETVCRDGFYRAWSAAIMNLTCSHGQWIGDVGECIPGDAYNARHGSDTDETDPEVRVDRIQRPGGALWMAAGAAVLALGMVKLGCLCQQRRDKEILNTAVMMSGRTTQFVAHGS